VKSATSNLPFGGRWAVPTKADVLELERAGAHCRALDLLLVRVERYYRAGTRCVLEGKATVAAADLEHVAFVEPRQASNEAQLEARRWIAARVLALALSRWPDTACVRLAPAATAPPAHAARDATRDARGRGRYARNGAGLKNRRSRSPSVESRTLPKANLSTQVTADRSSMDHPAAKKVGEPEEAATRPRGVRVEVHGSSG
jgi:hypothetical protein